MKVAFRKFDRCLGFEGDSSCQRHVLAEHFYTTCRLYAYLGTNSGILVWRCLKLLHRSFDRECCGYGRYHESHYHFWHSIGRWWHTVAHSHFAVAIVPSFVEYECGKLAFVCDQIKPTLQGLGLLKGGHRSAPWEEVERKWVHFTVIQISSAPVRLRELRNSWFSQGSLQCLTTSMDTNGWSLKRRQWKHPALLLRLM